MSLKNCWNRRNIKGCREKLEFLKETSRCEKTKLEEMKKECNLTKEISEYHNISKDRIDKIKSDEALSFDFGTRQQKYIEAYNASKLAGFSDDEYELIGKLVKKRTKKR